MKNVKFKWELTVSIASLIISIVAVWYTFKSERNCDTQNKELLALFEKMNIEINDSDLNFKKLELIQKNLSSKIDKLSTSNCEWSDTLNNKRQQVVSELWKIMDKVIRRNGGSITESERHTIIGIIDTLDLFCFISTVSCRKRDRDDLDRLRIVYTQK